MIKNNLYSVAVQRHECIRHQCQQSSQHMRQNAALVRNSPHELKKRRTGTASFSKLRKRWLRRVMFTNAACNSVTQGSQRSPSTGSPPCFHICPSHGRSSVVKRYILRASGYPFMQKHADCNNKPQELCPRFCCVGKSHVHYVPFSPIHRIWPVPSPASP